MEEPAVNPGWRKSSYSSNGGGACVEVGTTPTRNASAILIRDTTDNGTGLVLRVSPAGWRRFIARVRAND